MKYLDCPVHIQPSWISWELVVQPCVNRNSPVRLLSQQWNVIEWACVLCECCIHDDWGNTFYMAYSKFFGKTYTPTLLGTVSLFLVWIWLCVTSGFSWSSNHHWNCGKCRKTADADSVRCLWILMWKVEIYQVCEVQRRVFKCYSAIEPT